MRPRRIVIAGGSGHLGMMLGRHFYEQGDGVSSISRFPKPHPWEAIHWDAENLGDWTSSLEDADVLVNLAGRSVRCRHTPGHRRVILHSRVRTSQILAEAVSECARPPRVWLNASSANIYPPSFQDDFDERSPVLQEWLTHIPSKWQASMEAVRAWEQAVYSTDGSNTRKVLLRLGPVMSPESGGAFDRLLWLVRRGLGGDMGEGEQYVSWIHDFDFLRAIDFLIDCTDMDGPVNIVAPCPLPNHQFMCNMRRAWCTSYFGLPAPKWLVHAASFLLRTEPEFVLKSRRVVPKRLSDAGFPFHFPKWRGACENLVQRWRLAHPED